MHKKDFKSTIHQKKKVNSRKKTLKISTKPSRSAQPKGGLRRLVIYSTSMLDISRIMDVFHLWVTRGSLQKLDFEIFWGDPPKKLGGGGDFNYTKRVNIFRI